MIASRALRRLLGGGAIAFGLIGTVSGLATSAHLEQQSAMSRLTTSLKQIANLKRVSALAEWDQLVMMPDREESHEERGEQLATLASVIHARETDAALGKLIAEAEAEAPADRRDAASVREARKRYDRATKIPAELAERKAKLGSSAYAAWAKAREANDWESFQPVLAECFSMVRAVAECTKGGEAELYDVCLGEFEPGMTAARLDELFAETKAALQPLIAAVKAAPQLSAGPLEGSFPKEAQAELNERIVRALGFAHGRCDVSVHPFTTSFGPADVRITTRYKPTEWFQGLAGSVHEAGHAMYESGLGRSGLPVDDALSMGVHESQSLFWERHVALSRPFWAYAGPLLREHLGVKGTDQAIYEAVNRVEPSLIRVEADELTYPMHVIMRYELERDLVRGRTEVKDLPKLWAAKMKELLGVDVPDNKRGCLQDVHWSGLAVGYFPTYLLGALMAAQLAHYIRKDIPDLDSKVAVGDFAPVKAWLHEHVHKYGSVHTSMDELLKESVGEPLNPKYLIDYLTDKYSPLYKLKGK